MSKKEIEKKEEENIQKDVVKEIKEKILTEVDKEIKNIIIENTKQYKEELKEELIEDVDNEIVDFFEKEEKRLIRGKNAAIFKRNVIILALLGIAIYFAYCLFDVRYFDFMKSECERQGNCTSQSTNNPSESDDQTKPTEIVKDKDWYIKNYGYLLDQTKLNLNADNVSAYYLYSMDRKVSEMKSQVLLNLAYSALTPKQIKTNSVTITVDGDDLKAAFEKLFGTGVQYKPTSFTYNCLSFEYNQDKNRFTADNTKCSTTNNKIVEEISDMYEEGNVLYIITSATIYNGSENSFYSFDNLYEPIITGVTETDITTNARRLNKYQYQFKKSEDNYYLDSIIKLK